MKLIRNAAIALVATAAAAAPVSAQVSGIGVADPAVVVASSQALQTAYTQIATTFQAQRTQIDQLQQQHTALLRQLDTNSDGQLSEAEQAAAQQANNPLRPQIEANESAIAQAQAPVNRARAYAIEQIAQQLNPSVQQVVSQGGLQLILAPNTVLYMSDAVNVSDDIVAALNQRLPAVSTAPPEAWQPGQQTVSLFQDVQEVLMMAAAQQQQAAANSAQQPAQPAVTGR
jgi:Skp family chaperone for outer membrane proteins